MTIIITDNGLFLFAAIPSRYFSYMAKIIATNPFASLSDLKAKLRISLPKPYEWRLINEPFSGECNGLSSLRGIVVATNGIEAVVVNNATVSLVRIAWFNEDMQENIAKGHKATAKQGFNPFEGFVYE